MMRVEYSIQLETESGGYNDQVNDMYQDLRFNYYRVQDQMCIKCDDIDADKLFNEKWIKIKVTIKIESIYDDKKELIETSEWAKYGISTTLY